MFMTAPGQQTEQTETMQLEARGTRSNEESSRGRTDGGSYSGTDTVQTKVE
jgi:hypothetical protein